MDRDSFQVESPEVWLTLRTMKSSAKSVAVLLAKCTKQSTCQIPKHPRQESPSRLYLIHLKRQFLISLLDSKGQSKYAHPSTTNCTRSHSPLKISIKPFHPRIAIVLWRRIASVYHHWTLSQWKFASISWISSRRITRRSSPWTHARYCQWHSA